jgi:hypothetical protein
MAERIVKALADDRATVEQCGAQAEKFSWKAAERHVDLYRQVLS